MGCLGAQFGNKGPNETLQFDLNDGISVEGIVQVFLLIVPRDVRLQVLAQSLPPLPRGQAALPSPYTSQFP